MAIEDHYVKSDGIITDSQAAWNASTSFANRVTFAIALKYAAAGNRVRICDAVTFSGSTVPTNSGTAAQPIIWHGADASGNLVVPTRTNGGALSTVGPLLTGTTGAYPRLDFSARSYHVFRALRITAVRGGALLLPSAAGWVDKCIIDNTDTGTSCVAVYAALNNAITDCDITIAGTGAAACISLANAGGKVIGCRLTGPDNGNGNGVLLTTRGTVCGCLIKNLDYGINLNAAGAYETTIYGNTITDCGTGILMGNFNGLAVPAIANNILRDLETYGAELAYATALPTAAVRNRCHNNSSGNYAAAEADWIPGADDVASAGDDFVSASDFQLLHDSTSVSAGLLGSNIGAFGGGFPEVTEVLDDVVYGGTLAGTYVEPAETDVRDGVNFGDGSQGSCVVPAAADVLRDVPVDVSGTGLLYVPTVNQVLDGVSVGVSGSGTVVLPSIADVRDGTFYGAGGNALKGDCVVYLYGDNTDSNVLSTAAGAGTYVPVDAGNVRLDVPVGPSPSAGTLKVPAEDVVKLNEHYGAGGTEYTGKYIGAGGGRKRLGALRG